MKHKFTFIDLFAGIGGFHHALDGLGGDCVLAVERDSNCHKVYQSIFPNTPIIEDIREITLDALGNEKSPKEIRKLVPEHDVLCAGFPCQPFSKSGKQFGIRDQTRGTLFYDIMSIILARKPKYVILENVRNLTSEKHKTTLKLIVESLRDAGYVVSDTPIVLSPHNLPTSEGGSPQIRERIFITAYLRTSTRDEPLIIPKAPFEDWSPANWRIDSVLSKDSSIPNLSEYKLSEEKIAFIEAWQDFVQRIPDDELPGHPIWASEFQKSGRLSPALPDWKKDFINKNRNFYSDSLDRKKQIDIWLKKKWGPNKLTVLEFPASMQKFEWQARSFQTTKSQRNLRKLLIQFRPSGVRVKPPTYAPALVAITQTSIIGERLRSLTPSEAARLQGMPSDIFLRSGVADSVAYKQLGNAVHVGVVSYVAKSLFNVSIEGNNDN
jgi:DNA (cytosine-5)-methyltransferase 1